MHVEYSPGSPAAPSAPVVEQGALVGILTEVDYVRIAAGSRGRQNGVTAGLDSAGMARLAVAGSPVLSERHVRGRDGAAHGGRVVAVGDDLQLPGITRGVPSAAGAAACGSFEVAGPCEELVWRLANL